MKERVMLGGLGVSVVAVIVLAVMTSGLSKEVATQNAQVKNLRVEAAEAVLVADEVKGFEERLARQLETIQALEQQVAAQRVQIEDLEKRPMRRGGRRDGGGGGDVMADGGAPGGGARGDWGGRRRGDMQNGPAGGMETPGGVDAAGEPSATGAPEVIESKVREVREQEREERRARREERQKERTERRVARYSEELGLNDQESSKVSEIFNEFESIQRSIWRQTRDGEIHWEEAQEMMESHNQSTRRALVDTIGEDRVQELEKVRDKEREQMEQTWRRSW